VSDITQIHYRVPHAAAESVANLLHELSSGGVEQRDEETLESPEAGLVEFVTWVPESKVDEQVSAVERLLSSLKDLGIETQRFSCSRLQVDSDAWVDAYKRHFRTTRIARRFVVKPSWEDYDVQPGDLMIELDPGMAFGTGLHASTKLVMSTLERVARLCPTPQTVLDLGCGTGILAIAVARLWTASKIIAVDNDPVAVEACRYNVAHNGLQDRIEVREGSAGSVEGQFSLICANLSYDVLSGLTKTLPRHLDDFGRLILSGLLASQAQELCVAFTSGLQLEPEYSEEENDWRSLLLRVRL